MHTYSLKEAIENKKIVAHKNILEGRITERSFVVSFFSFLSGKADKIYQDPAEFYKLTYMTQNLNGIFNDVLTRLSKGGARPLLVIDTTFGGGKTHTLVGLYHLFKNSNIALENPQIKDILDELGLEKVPDIEIVAMDCRSLSSLGGKQDTKTLWGEIGRQLNCYELIREYDEKLRRPTDKVILDMLESPNKPVLILIDELVNYLKDAKAEKIEDQNLAEITVSFLHTLTEVVANMEKTMLIITLPGYEPAYKEETELLEEYKKIVKSLTARESAFVVPLRKEDIYEIVKRRLFEYIDDNLARKIAEEMEKFYSKHSEYLPVGLATSEYYEKLRKTYPFHPLIIDLLYDRVSTISEFQKTRGVLRLLAHVLRRIYQIKEQLSADLLITPGIIDLSDNEIFQELTNKVGRGDFQNVIRTDIVNEENNGRAQALDSQPFLGRHVRIATSIYLYTLIGATKELSVGGTVKELALSVSMPKLIYPADVNNDIENLDKVDGLYYIYERAGRWYFSVEENLNKVIADAKNRVAKPAVRSEIKSRLGKMLRTEIFDVRIWEHDIRNPLKPTLVVTDYEEVNAVEGDEVPPEVRNIITKEGTSYRTKQNLMYILVPRKDRISRMIDAITKFIAINEIKGSPRSKSELKVYKKKLEKYLKESDSLSNNAIELSYSLIYYPHRTEVKSVTIQDGYEGAKNLPEKVYLALNKANKIVDKLNPEYISDKVLSGKNYITFKEIYDEFQSAPSHPLPKNKQVLMDAVKGGVMKGLYAVYTAGVGDLDSIDKENYKTFGRNFYFKRQLEHGPRDGYYILPKERAEYIEEELKKMAAEDKEEHVPGLGVDVLPQIPTPSTTIENIDNFDELRSDEGFFAENLIFELKKPQILQSLGSKLTILTLGISKLKVNVRMDGENIAVSIEDAEIRDIGELAEIMYRLSNIVKKEVNIRLEMKYGEGLELSEDIVKTLSSLKIFQDELNFRANIRKMAG